MFRRRRRHLREFVSPRRGASGGGGGRAGIIAVVSKCGIRGKAEPESNILRRDEHIVVGDISDKLDEDEDGMSSDVSGTSTGSSVAHRLLFSPDEEDGAVVANDEHPAVWVKSNHWQCLQQSFRQQRPRNVVFGPTTKLAECSPTS